ncbi:MAG: DUF1016 family protein [Candidatus Lokiarchaeota archaeon]|nr:DUF1016 family protein [Candidatus Lokiarchaeota archaeon]
MGIDLEHGTIAVGWKSIGDASSLDWDDIWDKAAETYPDKSDRSHSIDANALWNFFHEIEIGDKILARRGRKILLAVGTVTKTAYYDWEKGLERVGGDENLCYPNFIEVDWEKLPIEYDELAFGMYTLQGPFDYDYYQELTQGEVPEPEESDTLNESRFRLERYLEDFIVTNFEQIFEGKYERYQTEGDSVGQQYPIMNDDGRVIGRIDILAKNREDESLLVIELKRDYGVDTTVGQILWYMGWVKENLCDEGQDVKGLIICTDKDEKLDYTLQMLEDRVEVKFYSVRFQLQSNT